MQRKRKPREQDRVSASKISSKTHHPIKQADSSAEGDVSSSSSLPSTSPFFSFSCSSLPAQAYLDACMERSDTNHGVQDNYPERVPICQPKEAMTAGDGDEEQRERKGLLDRFLRCGEM